MHWRMLKVLLLLILNLVKDIQEKEVSVIYIVYFLWIWGFHCNAHILCSYINIFTIAALHALKRYNDAISAYDEGIAKFPDDAALKSGLAQVKRDKDGPPPRSVGSMPGMQNPFGDQLIQKIMLNPKTRPYLQDKEFMAKIYKLQRDPNSLTECLG